MGKVKGFIIEWTVFSAAAIIWGFMGLLHLFGKKIPESDSVEETK